MVQYFKAWRLQRLDAVERKIQLPPFDPPKLKMVDGLKSLLHFFNERMSAVDFQAGVQRAFVTTGLVPNSSGSFELYKNPRRSVPDELRPAVRACEGEVLPEAQSHNRGRIPAT